MIFIINKSSTVHKLQVYEREAWEKMEININSTTYTTTLQYMGCDGLCEKKKKRASTCGALRRPKQQQQQQEEEKEN